MNDTSISGPNGQGLERTVDQASTSAHEKIERVAGALHPGVERLTVGAHQAVDRLASAATQAGHTLDAKGAQLKDLQQKLTEDCRSYVREKPVTALAIAAAGGFLVSLLLRR